MKNSGSEVDASATPEISLSTGPLRYRTASRPRMMASGTAIAADQKARNRVFQSRSLMEPAISWPLDSAVPRSPCRMPQSQLKYLT